MSLILDALNRAERDRKKSQPVPDLQTMHEPVSPVAQTPRNKILAWLIVLVVFLVAVAAFYEAKIKDSKGSAQDLPVSNSHAPDPPATTAPAPSAPKLPAPELSAVLPAQESPVLPLPDSVQAGLPVPAAPQKPELAAPAEELSASPARSSALDELYAAARAEEPMVQSDPVSDLYVAPAAEVEPEEKQEVAAVAPLVTAAVRDYNSLIEMPDLGDLPWGFRQQIPSLNYVRHNFQERGVTSVVINGSAHYAGGILAQDLVLEEIYVDGVILRFKQIRFKLKALNSWINM